MWDVDHPGPLAMPAELQGRVTPVVAPQELLMSRQITGPTFPTVKLLGRRNHHDFIEFRFLKKTTIPAVLLATVVTSA